jgi:hypothetical protein
MPTYHFDFEDNGRTASTGDGLVLPGLDAAVKEAIEAVIGIAGDEIPDDGMARELALVIRDEEGRPRCRVRLDFQVEMLSPGRD